MKHLYKTKEGEILEAEVISYTDEDIKLLDDKWHKLSEVQEVVLDKDGEPFIFEGEVVCVGDLAKGDSMIEPKEIFNSYIVDMDIVLLTGTPENTFQIHTDNLTSNTPKHPQKKGIEKMDLENLKKKINNALVECAFGCIDREDVQRLSYELADEVNNLTRE